MARDLSSTYQTYAQGRTRRPTLFVYIDHDGGTFDASQYVTAASASFSLEHEASEARLSILDKDGMFDPLTSGQYAHVFDENNRVVIKMGYGDEVYNVFTGRIPSGKVFYQAGRPDVMTVPVFDMGKNLWPMRVTSDLYQTQQVNDILTDVFTSKGGVDAGDIALAAQSYPVEQIQFVDEPIMDIGANLMMPSLYRLFWDYDGKLVSRAPAPPESSSWDYSLGDVVLVSHQWDDPTVNKVIVWGRSLEPERQLGPEEQIYYVHADILRGGSWEDVTIYWDPSRSPNTGGTPYANCRVEKVSGDPHDDAWWARVKGPREYDWGVRWKFPPSSDHELKARFYGQAVTYVVPRVTGSAEDGDLIADYGEILLEVDNPVVQSESDAASIASAMLDRAKSYRYRPQIRVVQNLVHEPGDRITFPHPRTGDAVACQVRRVTHTAAQGECSTTLDLLKL